MAGVPFVRDLEFDYGALQDVAPGIRRLVANNPGPFTYYGTGTYVLGAGEVAVIDAGPRDEAHVDALLKGLKGETITHQLITHTHIDHSPGAALVKEAVGAKTWAFGPHGAGKRLEGIEVEEGGDRDFVPDHEVRDGDIIEGGDWAVECVFTPGHTSNHMCFARTDGSALFTGDHVMGWSTTVVVPPDGDMAQYMASLRRLLERDDAVLWPTHGPPVRDPKPFLQALIAHREGREAQILEQLLKGPQTIKAMVADMYADVDKGLHPAAALSVFSHMIKMAKEGRLQARSGAPTLDAVYERA